MIHKSFNFLIALTTICAVALGSAATASANPPSVPPFALTESGIVLGTTANGVNEFLGIPYATPPVGPLRWTPPKPYGFFHGFVLNANQFGSECTQPGSGSENCLFLNVYTPEPEFAFGASSGKDSRHQADFLRGRPVMVWIHGGGLVTGGGDEFDPSLMAKQGVVVVTINYRLGYLGFFAQSGIDAEHHINGNYGFMDQQFALQWVQRNIAGFGGDPSEVTIFGESAGGQSVYAQVASPTAAHLFRAAIAESGSYVNFQDYFNFIVPTATGATTGTTLVPAGDAVAAFLGCSSETSQCLRGLPATAFAAAEPSTIYPFVDGTLLPQTIAQAFASGKFNRVPIISGTNHDEWRFFVAEEFDLAGMPLTDLEYPAAVAALVGESASPSFIGTLVNMVYSLSDFPSPAAPLALGALGTDDIFTCPARNADLLLAAKVPTYVYEFHDETAPSFFPPLSFPLGDAHGIELEYLFDDPALILNASQLELSDTMIGYWTQFAKTLNPNSPGAPNWSKYSAGGSIESLVAPTPVTESDLSFNTDHKCSALWDTF